MYIYIYVYTYVCMHIHTYTYRYVYVFICTHTYAPDFRFWRQQYQIRAPHGRRHPDLRGHRHTFWRKSGGAVVLVWLQPLYRVCASYRRTRTCLNPRHLRVWWMCVCLCVCVCVSECVCVCLTYWDPHPLHVCVCVCVFVSQCVESYPQRKELKNKIPSTSWETKSASRRTASCASRSIHTLTTNSKLACPVSIRVYIYLYLLYIYICIHTSIWVCLYVTCLVEALGIHVYTYPYMI